ncbi:hypothetical protein MNBD_GAMMA12-2784 [hydrothermal vent metagenome]|uniref:FHA domain-containing protein n=1 Tax=hydrothermal vent metagenome TaxID=652676 RepID=A0A3B0Y3N5_9ZZZZ
MILIKYCRVFIVLIGMMFIHSVGYSIDKKIYHSVKSAVLLVGVCTKQVDIDLLPATTKQALLSKFGATKFKKAMAKLKHAKKLAPYCSKFSSGKNTFFYRLRSTGSSFLINKQGYLITNFHVVGNYSNIVVFDANRSMANAKIAKVVWRNKENDLAILKIDNISDERKPITLANPALINSLVNSDVWSLGYPGVSNTSAVQLLSFQAKSDKGVIRAKPEERYLMTNHSVSTSTIEHSAYINSGNSGGPLVDYCGKVLGVNQSVPSVTRGRGIGWSVHIKHVIAGLQLNGIDYTVSSKSCPYYIAGVSSTLSKLFDYIIFATLLMLIIMVVWLYKKRNLKPAGLTQFMRREMSRYFKTNSKSVKGSEKEANQTLVGVLKGFGTLEGVDLEMRGDDEIVIGRDSAGLTTPIDSIGRKHACLYWQAHLGVIWIEDLKSTNGTFLENGEEVSPGEKAFLKVGAGFYLSEPENGFKIVDKL